MFGERANIKESNQLPRASHQMREKPECESESHNTKATILWERAITTERNQIIGVSHIRREKPELLSITP